MQRVDIVIVGGGLVGLTTALSIRKETNLTVAVIDPQPLNPLNDDPHLRVSALNGASHQLLQNIGVWPLIEKSRLQAYQNMHVWDKDGFGSLDFDQGDIVKGGHELTDLGWIVENDVIRNALWQKVSEDNNILQITEPLTSINIGEAEVFLTIENHLPIIAKLVIGADGANSWVRKTLAMPITFHDYDHHAVVATVECSQGHQNTAWQVFLNDGPLAFLPLFDKQKCSIVWSLPPHEAERVIKLSNDDFNKAITAASDGKLGQVCLKSNRASFGLTMRLANDFVKDRVVLIGDAAHTIHPLAGQGVNLGLIDVSALVQTIKQNIEQGLDIANAKQLNHFARWRKAQAADMLLAMETIKQGFSLQQTIPKVMRGVGMSLINQISPIKKILLKHAMGYGIDLPELSKNNDGL